MNNLKKNEPENKLKKSIFKPIFKSIITLIYHSQVLIISKVMLIVDTAKFMFLFLIIATISPYPL